AKGEFDGYLLYVNDVPVGWCQVGKRDRLKKLVEQFELEPDPEMWAITCFFIIPKYRKKKWATYMLRAVVADLYKQGVRKIESFPTRRPFPTAGDLWTGKESTYESVGFKLVRDHPTQPVMAVHYKRKVKEKESTSDESPQK
ncbi:MAG TPA: GNAT family N-acetyltransferase, partial [bacterium]